MNVFISYSVKDTQVVRLISETIKPSVASVKYWDESKQYGEQAWKSIEQWINDSDIMIVVITDHTISRAMAVGNEVGMAKEKGVKIIPLVCESVNHDDLACLNGITHIKFNTQDPIDAIDELHDHIKRLISKENAQAWFAIGAMVLAAIASPVISKLIEKPRQDQNIDEEDGGDA